MDGPRLLLAWRNNKGLTQTEVSRRLGVSQTSVCDWERGNKSPSVNSAIDLEELTEGEVPVRAWRTPRDTEAA